MEYDQFLDRLKAEGWHIPNKSFASKVFDGQWQIAFIRIGGRFQLPGQVTFVLCIRHLSLRTREGDRPNVVKDPYDYPFKLTPEEIIASSELKYRSRLLNYDKTALRTSDDWLPIASLLNGRATDLLIEYSASQLREELLQLDQVGYLEQIWLEDLAQESSQPV